MPAFLAVLIVLPVIAGAGFLIFPRTAPRTGDRKVVRIRKVQESELPVHIGTIEILGILTTEVHLRGAFWSLIVGFNINVAGF